MNHPTRSHLTLPFTDLDIGPATVTGSIDYTFSIEPPDPDSGFPSPSATDLSVDSSELCVVATFDSGKEVELVCRPFQDHFKKIVSLLAEEAQEKANELAIEEY